MASQRATMESNYQQTLSDLDRTQKQNTQNTDAALNRTAVEAQKANMNYNEVQNAYGLSSGAMAQARLARDNTTAQNMTLLRRQQQENDAELERQRVLLGKQYQGAIAKAQADNDFARAQALYQQAQKDEANLRADQQNAAALMAKARDYSLYQQLYGLSDSQLATLNNYYAAANAPKASSGTSPSNTSPLADLNGLPDTDPDSLVDSYYKQFAGQQSSFKTEGQANNAIADVVSMYIAKEQSGDARRMGSFEDWARQNGLTGDDLLRALYIYNSYTKK